MEVKVAILGVCPFCQEGHPVYKNLGIEASESDDIRNFYRMAAHLFFGDYGPWCDGEGTVPQEIIKD